MESTNVKLNLTLSGELYEAAKNRLVEWGFSTVEELILYFTEEALQSQHPVLGAEEEQMIKERLRELGYL